MTQDQHRTRRREDELERCARATRRFALWVLIGVLAFWSVIIWAFWPKHPGRGPKIASQRTAAVLPYTAPSRARAHLSLPQ